MLASGYCADVGNRSIHICQYCSVWATHLMKLHQSSVALAVCMPTAYYCLLEKFSLTSQETFCIQ